jgi:hypothetical protein
MYKSEKKIATKFKRCFAKHKSTALIATHKTIYNLKWKVIHKMQSDIQNAM